SGYGVGVCSGARGGWGVLGCVILGGAVRGGANSEAIMCGFAAVRRRLRTAGTAWASAPEREAGGVCSGA
ncbi:hypothetical protein, partial [Kribbella swartbergensis]